MLRNFAIVATAFEVHPKEARRAGWIGFIALLLGTACHSLSAWASPRRRLHGPCEPHYPRPGAVTYIVGPVTGTAIGASSDVIALSIATGVFKAILVMVATPAAAGFLRLGTPPLRHGVRRAGRDGERRQHGLAATDRRLVPYGGLVATFHTAIGCLLVPSAFFLVVKALFGR